MVAFMKDPAGDAPWEEDDQATDVVHLPDPKVNIQTDYFPS